MISWVVIVLSFFPTSFLLEIHWDSFEKYQFSSCNGFGDFLPSSYHCLIYRFEIFILPEWLMRPRGGLTLFIFFGLASLFKYIQPRFLFFSKHKIRSKPRQVRQINFASFNQCLQIILYRISQWADLIDLGWLIITELLKLPCLSSFLITLTIGSGWYTLCLLICALIAA